MPDELLMARRVEAGYPNKKILFGVDFEVRRGEVVALLGANGSGKSTALNSVSGFIRPSAGSIKLSGRELVGRAPHEIFRIGIAQVSQARDLFPDMTVEENLRLGAKRRPQVEPNRQLATVLKDFPRLQERLGQTARTMSGGEQQMLAIARALMSAPTLLLLDEPSGGLAPKFVDEISAVMMRLKAAGTTMLVIEQNLKLALAVADRFLVLKAGHVTEGGDLRQGGSPEAIVQSIYF
jgi:branched-chain amino acid transport system ATP-binding protein